MRKILIDSDVILDLFFDRKPFSDDAAFILGLCEQNQLTAYVTPVIISNIYYLLHQTAGHQKVIEKLQKLLTLVDVLSMDKKVVLNALNSDFKDFEDALQNFAAENSRNIDVIVTRNIKDYKKSNLGVMTPAMFIKVFDK